MVREGGEEPRQETQKEQRPRGNLLVIISGVLDQRKIDQDSDPNLKKISDLDPTLGKQPGSNLVRFPRNVLVLVNKYRKIESSMIES